MWGLAYYFTDNFFVNLVVSRMRRISNWMNSGRLAKYLIETKPDVIVSTHFFPSEVIGDLKSQGLVNSRLVTVVTDYQLHSWWIVDCTDMYVVGSEWAKKGLLGWNVPPEKVQVLGIPTEPIFSKKLDTDRIFEKDGLARKVFTILVIGGGFGVGPIENIVKVINTVSGKPIQVIAVCGHNEELTRRMEELRGKLDIQLKVLGFIDNVYEYMEISNVLISKSGGITVAESLAKEIPLVVISPIIGQETRNSDFIVGSGAALKLDKVDDLKGALEDLIAHPEKIEEMKEAIRKIKKPAACYDVAKLAIEMCDVK